jgi:hypothetical protein
VQVGRGSEDVGRYEGTHVCPELLNLSIVFFLHLLRVLSALSSAHTHLHHFHGLIGNRRVIRILADRLLRHGVQT